MQGSGKTLQMFFSLITNMHILQDLKIMAHQTLQEIIKITEPEGAMHRFTWSVSRDLMEKQM